MENIIKIVQILNNAINNLGRKFDSLALELRNKKTPPTSISVDIGDNVAKGVSDALKEGFLLHVLCLLPAGFHIWIKYLEMIYKVS